MSIDFSTFLAGNTSQFSIIPQPNPIGYWVLYPGAVQCTMFAMYVKPTDEQIRNTEQLLGWKWRDA